VTDAAILARATSGALVVVSAGRTNRHQLSGAIDALQTVGAKVAGLVLSMVPTRGPDSYAYAYGYGYSYGQGYGYVQGRSRAETRAARKAGRKVAPHAPSVTEPVEASSSPAAQSPARTP